MSFLLRPIARWIADKQYASPEVDSIARECDQVGTIIFPTSQISGIVTCIIEYGGIVQDRRNAEITRIFMQESWKFPLSSPRNQQFVDRFISGVTILTIPCDALQHLDKISLRIKQMPSLRSLIVRVGNDDARDAKSVKEFEKFFRQTFTQHPAIDSISFPEGTTLTELNAITEAQPELKELSCNSVKQFWPDENCKSGLTTVIGRLARLSTLTLTNQDLIPEAAKGIFSSCMFIEKLDFRGNIHSQPLSVISENLRHLSSLVVDAIQFQEFAKFSACSQLRELTLATTAVPAAQLKANGFLIKGLAKIRSLEKLNISRIELREVDFKQLKDFRNSSLRVLTMKLCKRNMNIVERCSSVREKATNSFAEAMFTIDSLEQLDMRGCSLSQREYGIIMSMRNLRLLRYGDEFLTPYSTESSRSFVRFASDVTVTERQGVKSQIRVEYQPNYDAAFDSDFS